MKIHRTQNAIRNILFGGGLKTLQILFPFIMRTVMLQEMGIRYLGLSGLFTSVLSVLSLAELGVGSAMVYSMYKPIAEDDRDTICALMNLYRFYYRIIGLAVLFLGLLLLPLLPRLVDIATVPPELDIYILYLLNLAAAVLSYWLFAYKNSLLLAHQRNDVSSRISIFTAIGQFGIQMGVLVLFHNYYYFVLASLFTQVLTNVLTAVIVDRMYPDYYPEGRMERKEVARINGRIRDLFTAKLATVVVGSVDTLVISAFLGLEVLAVYQNYYFIMNAVWGMIAVIFAAVIAGIGNSLVTETREKNYQDFKLFTFIMAWILCVCCCCFLVLYQPFMELWAGAEYMLSYSHVVLFCIYFYVCELAMVWATVKDSAGLWHADRLRPLIGSLVNLVLNLILVRRIGLYGILLSTILSYVVISMPWLICNLFRFLYKRRMREYLKELAQYVIVTAATCVLVCFVCSLIPCTGIAAVAVNFILAVLISNGVLFAIYRKSGYWMAAFAMLKRR